ncbi:REP element-mobilizing transposase RayT [Thermonema lapsum]|uniref:REP element-mobilizing transposase RayT n=1 Tax=Thermonema lapsum TaxID=28195 RepID=A0A846MQV9_9BACT|nr:transposase [Thermonema lapsum]NIK73953.1 REP element-mobilizing transposase RayT [Thermonema lapsum]
MRGYDYSKPGAYFITIVTHNRQCLFGEIKNGAMVLNDAGFIARKYWLEIPSHFPHTQLDEFIIMPNHIHGIIIICDNEHVGAKNTDIVGAKNIDIVVEAKNFSPLQQTPKPLVTSTNQQPQSPSRTIGSIIRGFKIGVTKWFRQNTDIYNVWQRNYYEHIIRNEKEFNNIRRYIINNPVNWANDKNRVK